MESVGFAGIALALVGAIFCGVYATDRMRFWWAIIPGLGAFTLVAALVADAFVGTDPANDWASVLVIAAGAAVIAAVLKREDAQRVMQIVAGISAIVAIMMSPILLATKVLFVVVVLAVGTVTLWGDTHQNKMLWPH